MARNPADCSHHDLVDGAGVEHRLIGVDLRHRLAGERGQRRRIGGGGLHHHRHAAAG